MKAFKQIALLAAVFLAGCGSQGPAAHDAATDAPDARADAPTEMHDAVTPTDATDAAADGAPHATPVILARAPGCGAARLALAGSDLYWTERATGAVKKVSVASAAETPTLVASNQPSPGPITADDTAIYWSNEGDRTIRTAPRGGDGGVSDGGAADGGAAPLLTAAETVSALLASDGVLYYGAGSSTYEVPRTGGSSKTLATAATCRPSTPGALAVGGAYLYQTANLLQFITRLHTDGTQLGNNPCVAADAGAPQIAVPETVTHTQGALLLDALYVAAGEVVWADHGWIAAKTVANLAQATSRDVAQTAGSNGITGFVVTGASIYLGESDDPGDGPTAHTIQIAPFAAAGADTPTATTVIATGQRGARSFVADATHVYWATHTPSPTSGAPDDCAIVSLAK